MKTRFYGFDSFAGFGEVSADDKHPFYTDANFATSVEAVGRRTRRVAGKDVGFELIPGFFNDSLKAGAASLGIHKARIVFIDSDTYSSASQALTFCIPIIQEGAFIVLDDYYSYRGSAQRGVARAFDEFVKAANITVRHVFTYGMGGAVYVVSGVAVSAGEKDATSAEQAA